MNYKKLALGRPSSNVDDRRLRPPKSTMSPQRDRSMMDGLKNVDFSKPNIAGEYIHSRFKAVSRTRMRPNTRTLDDWKKPLEE